jgi:hypothetical protein
MVFGCTDVERQQRQEREDKLFEIFVERLRKACDARRIFVGDFALSNMARELAVSQLGGN